MATEALLPMQPSLGSATNTRVDSSKLHLQCRVSNEDMSYYTEPKNDQEDIKRNKYRYCIHKDELTIAVGRPWDVTVAHKKTNNAYPRVISNLGALDGNSNRGRITHKVIAYMNHFARSIQEKHCIIRAFKGEFEFADTNAAGTVLIHSWPRGNDVDTGLGAYFAAEELDFIPDQVLPYMFDHLPMGYATTLGWAHPNTGDTMVTVMIGGIRTVMNGDFEIFTGDLIQWYWPFELPCFKRDGRRKQYLNGWYEKAWADGSHYMAPPNLDPSSDIEADYNVGGEPPLSKDAVTRKRFHSQVYGQSERSPKYVPRIKPYIRDHLNPRMYDGLRVFAIATSSARPHEMVDIKISRQTC